MIQHSASPGLAGAEAQPTSSREISLVPATRKWPLIFNMVEREAGGWGAREVLLGIDLSAPGTFCTPPC